MLITAVQQTELVCLWDLCLIRFGSDFGDLQADRHLSARDPAHGAASHHHIFVSKCINISRFTEIHRGLEPTISALNCQVPSVKTGRLSIWPHHRALEGQGFQSGQCCPDLSFLYCNLACFWSCVNRSTLVFELLPATDLVKPVR